MLSVYGRTEIIKKEQEFAIEIYNLLSVIKNSDEKEYKINKYYEILKLLDNYNIIFYNETNKWNRFIDVMEKKLKFFIKTEKDISEKTKIFLKKYFRCKAICKYKNRCKNKINRKESRCFCKVHKKYILKFKNILKKITNFDDNIIEKITFYSF